MQMAELWLPVEISIQINVINCKNKRFHSLVLTIILFYKLETLAVGCPDFSSSLSVSDKDLNVFINAGWRVFAP